MVDHCVRLFLWNNQNFAADTGIKKDNQTVTDYRKNKYRAQSNPFAPEFCSMRIENSAAKAIVLAIAL